MVGFRIGAGPGVVAELPSPFPLVAEAFFAYANCAA
jgi:hypothetical protein